MSIREYYQKQGKVLPTKIGDQLQTHFYNVVTCAPQFMTVLE